MRITIEFDVDNAAFVDNFDGEIAVICRQAAEKATRLAKEELRSSLPAQLPLHDTNGNTVGNVQVRVT